MSTRREREERKEKLEDEEGEEDEPEKETRPWSSSPAHHRSSFYYSMLSRYDFMSFL